MSSKERLTAGARALADKGVAEAKDLAVNDVLGAPEWRRSKIGYLLGVGTIVRGIGTTLGGIARSLKGTMRMVSYVFRRETVEPLPTRSTDAAERFQVAMQVYRRSEQDVALDIAATNRMFNLYFILTALMVAFGIIGLGWDEEFSLISVGRFALVPVLLALTARASFYNWQLRTRRLGSVREWLSKPSEWMTTGEAASGRGKAAALLLAIGLGIGALSLGGDAALAQSAPGIEQPSGFAGVGEVFKDPSTDDFWRRVLEYVFPNVPPLGNSMQTGSNLKQGAAIASAFGTFLAVLMTLSSLFLTYHLTVGMVSTAHEGKVLGSRFHQFFAPVRVVLGVGMLAPIIKGYCTAQLLVLQIALWGGSFGNAIWSSYVDSLTLKELPAPIMPETMPLFRDLMALEVCYATLAYDESKAAAVRGDSGSAANGSSVVGPYPEKWTGERPWDSLAALDRSVTNYLAGAVSFGNWQPLEPVYSHLDYGRCGKVTMTVQPPKAARGDKMLMAKAEFDVARRAALDRVRPVISNLAAQLARWKSPGSEETDPPDFASVVEAMGNYNREINAAANVFMDAVNTMSLDKVREEMKQRGWATAGVFYMTISRLHEATATLMAERPEIELGGAADWTGGRLDLIRKSLSDPDSGSMPAFAQWWATGLENVPEIPFEAVQAGQVEQGGELDRGFQFVFRPWLLKAALDNFHVDLSKGSAISEMIGLGHAILNAFFWAIAAIGLAKAGGALGFGATAAAAGAAAGTVVPGIGNIIGAIKGFVVGAAVGKFIAGLSSVFLTAAATLFVVGVVHAYIIPMIPAIFMTFTVLGMLILVIEGVIAAPLWAFAHIRMDGGQDFIEQAQRPGYMLLFNLLLRIPLALFGLFFSYLVFDVMAWFVSVTFNQAFIGATTGHGYGFIGLLVAIVMVGYLHYQIALRSFGLISAVPERVSRWFGAQSDDLNEDRESRAAVGLLINASERKYHALSQVGVGAHRGKKQPTGTKTGPTTKHPSGEYGKPPQAESGEGGREAPGASSGSPASKLPTKGGN